MHFPWVFSFMSCVSHVTGVCVWTMHDNTVVFVVYINDLPFLLAKKQ